MPSQSKLKPSQKESDYSIIHLMLTIAREALRNVNETTHITIGEKKSGEKFIRAERMQNKVKSTR
jgi:hypothetical protein